MDLDVVADYGNEIGENPLWHPGDGRLYWCGHDNGSEGELFRYDPATGESERFNETGYVGGFTIQSDGSLLLFMDGRATVLRDGEEEPVLDDLPGADDDVLFNDVIADPEGRVFCGTRYPTMDDDRTGGLYRLDPDGSIREVVDGVEVSNGLGFTPDRTGLYYTDSMAREIYEFDYNRATGELSNRRTFVEVADDDGVPDGMTVDAEGYVWSAHAFGHHVVRYAPDGTEDRRIEFPLGMVTSVTFGGADYGDLYVTSGGGQDKERYGEHAGALFRADPGVRGVEEFASRIGLD